MGSATMALLKGKNKGETKAAKPSVDEELAEAPGGQGDDGASVEEVEAATSQIEAEEAAEGAEEGSDQVDSEGQDVELDAEQGVEQEAAGVALPTSKTEVHALKQAELPGVMEALGLSGEGLDLKGKKQAIMDHLFPKGGKAKIAIAGSDALAQISTEIENLKTRAEIEDRLGDIVKVEGENFFRKGGLLVRLAELGDFGEFENLQAYIIGNGIAKDYRTARYWMTIYTGLLEAGIPYSEVEEIGWTKLAILLIAGVLTKDNYEEWKQKAIAMNVPTLQATVDAAVASGSQSPGTSSDSGGIKSMVFKFHQDQTDTANDAIAKAKKVAGTESKEVAADLIFTEYLATAPNKKQEKVKADAAPAAGYEPDTLDVGAFLKAIKLRFDDPKEAMGFLFQDAPESEQPELAEGEDAKSYFEIIFPEVDIELNIP